MDRVKLEQSLDEHFGEVYAQDPAEIYDFVKSLETNDGLPPTPVLRQLAETEELYANCTSFLILNPRTERRPCGAS